MDKTELNEVRKITDAYMHTVEVLADSEIKANENRGIKNNTKEHDIAKCKHRAIINANKYNEYDLVKHSEFKKTLENIMVENNVNDLKLNRADLAINFYDDKSFNKYLKLNLYLLNLISLIYTFENTYVSEDVKGFKKHSIAIKNDRMQIEFYDKQKESNNTSPVAARLEFRKLKMGEHDTNYLANYWTDILKKLPKLMDVYIENINDILEDKYYNTDKKVKEWNNVNSFIARHQLLICSRKQLIDIYKRLGAKNPLESAKSYKKRNYIEYFVKDDLKTYIGVLIEIIENYFEN